MSYDLAVFDPAAAPTEREAFLEWFDRQAEWGEPRDHNDPRGCSSAIRPWFYDMIAQFPAMNGPYSKEERPEDEATLTDYSLGTSLVYAAFAWSKADQA